MRFTQELGVVAATGDAFKPEKIECKYKTGAAITVGKAVMPQATDGSTVITATTALDHSIIGIYEGKSTRLGAATAVTGFTGNDAISGEKVWITVAGPCTLLAYEVTTDSVIALGGPLSYAVQAGIATLGAAPAATLIVPACALSTNTATATSGSALLAHVRYL